MALRDEALERYDDESGRASFTFSESDAEAAILYAKRNVDVRRGLKFKKDVQAIEGLFSSVEIQKEASDKKSTALYREHAALKRAVSTFDLRRGVLLLFVLSARYNEVRNLLKKGRDLQLHRKAIIDFAKHIKKLVHKEQSSDFINRLKNDVVAPFSGYAASDWDVYRAKKYLGGDLCWGDKFYDFDKTPEEARRRLNDMYRTFLMHVSAGKMRAERQFFFEVENDGTKAKSHLQKSEAVNLARMVKTVANLRGYNFSNNKDGDGRVVYPFPPTTDMFGLYEAILGSLVSEEVSARAAVLMKKHGLKYSSEIIPFEETERGKKMRAFLTDLYILFANPDGDALAEIPQAHGMAAPVRNIAGSPFS